jgi:hypothetical protein
MKVLTYCRPSCAPRGDKTKPSTMCYYLEPVKREMSKPMANGTSCPRQAC